MRKKILISVLVVLFTSSVLAFPAELEVVERNALVDDPAVFNVTVENDGSESDRFRISSILSPPVTSAWFDHEYIKEIPAGEQKSFVIEVTPAENAIQQNYAFTVNLRSLNGEELERRESYFTVKNRYDLTITSFQLSDTEVKPGESINVSATIKNTDSDTLEDFSARLTGFGQQQTETGAILGAGDSIRYSFRLKVPEMESPGNQSVNLSVIKDGERKHYISQPVKIQRVRSIDRQTGVKDRLLSKTRKYRLENNGNVKDEVTVNAELPVYLDPLVSFSAEPDSSVATSSGQQYSWNFDLEPGEVQKLSYTVDYSPALVFLTLLLVGIAGLKKLQTDLKLSKSAASTGEGKVKIRIELENNSGTPMRDIEVKDFVPDIAEVSTDFEFARPVMTKTSNGTRLRWEIDELSPGEQRVFEYSLKPLVEVEGGVALPSLEVSKDGSKIKESSELEVEFNPE